MQGSFKVVSENQDRRFITVKEVAGLKISKSIYQPGYWFVTEYLSPVPANDLSSKHFIISGGFTESTGVLPARLEGWKSWEDPGVIPAGSWRREALNGCEIWCVWNKLATEGRVDHVSVVFLSAGQQYTIPNQSNLFSASGVLLCNEQALEDETHYVLSNGERVVCAEKDAYFMHWPVNQEGG